MNEDQIIAQAQRRVAERRQARHEHQKGGQHWFLLALVVAVVLGFVLYPMPLPQKLLLAMGGVCGLRPDHSYFAGDLQLPLEARDTGMYAGLTLTVAWLLARRRVKAARIGGWLPTSVVALMFASMVFDGVNSTLMELSRPHLYLSTNSTRLITGLLSGIAIGVVLTWLLGDYLRPGTAPSLSMLIASPGELLGPLALCALFGLLVTREQAGGYYPIALLSVGGLLLLLVGVALLPIVRIGRLRGRIATARHLIAPTALALLIAFAVLAGSALLRWS